MSIAQKISDGFNKRQQAKLILQFADGTQQEPVEVVLTEFNLDFRSDIDPGLHCDPFGERYGVWSAAKRIINFTLKGRVVEPITESVPTLQPYIPPMELDGEFVEDAAFKDYSDRLSDDDYETWSMVADSSRREYLESLKEGDCVQC